MDRRELALKIAWHYLGTWYRWGGSDPDGFDCSGLIVEIMQAVGLLERGSDMTAEGLRRRYFNKKIPDGEAEPGDLVFWINAGGHAYHVGILVAPGFYLGAEGGGPTITDTDAARRHDAFVKVRPIASRRGPTVYCDPFMVV